MGRQSKAKEQKQVHFWACSNHHFSNSNQHKIATVEKWRQSSLVFKLLFSLSFFALLRSAILYAVDFGACLFCLYLWAAYYFFLLFTITFVRAALSVHVVCCVGLKLDLRLFLSLLFSEIRKSFLFFWWIFTES